jgi:ribA/ribD-fused uncharacterized protein
MSDWESYAVHDEKNIKGFFGREYRWLSNFHPAHVIYEELRYYSVENAYQAAKCIPEQRERFQYCEPWLAKDYWKRCTMLDASSDEWDARKHRVMAKLVYQKFAEHGDLNRRLLDTGEKYLEELNAWGDTYWGVDIRKGGENNLGKILMKLRTFLRDRQNTCYNKSLA